MTGSAFRGIRKTLIASFLALGALLPSLAEKDLKASVSAQGLVKFTITDADGWKWVSELLPIDNGGELQFRGIATGTKKGEPTQVCPVWTE